MQGDFSCGLSVVSEQFSETGCCGTPHPCLQFSVPFLRDLAYWIPPGSDF